jgi:hypothetical protein
MSNNKEPTDNQLEDFKKSVKVNYFTKIFNIYIYYLLINIKLNTFFHL